jgi:membrane-associated phospholipid phosphatase
VDAPWSSRAGVGPRPGFGALLPIAAIALFAGIAYAVFAGHALTAFDMQVSAWLHARATPAMTRSMLAITQLHSTYAIACYGVLAAVLLWLRRDWRRITTVLACIGGGLLLNGLVKLATYSFPSGHVAASTIFYGLGVAWVFERTRSVAWRSAALIGAGLAIVLVAFSRMYLGVHYLSDVAAAFAEGVAWLSLCLAALAAFWRAAPRAPEETPG